MNKQKGDFKYKFAAFMYGRNGFDELYKGMNIIILILILVSIIINAAVKNNVLHYVLYGTWIALFAFQIFRVFSKNLPKRQKENADWITFSDSLKRQFTYISNKFKYRKVYSYKTCPKCHAKLRLPKKKGKHTVECPKCHTEFQVKI